jgi:hypothetical protein
MAVIMVYIGQCLYMHQLVGKPDGQFALIGGADPDGQSVHDAEVYFTYIGYYTSRQGAGYKLASIGGEKPRLPILHWLVG